MVHRVGSVDGTLEGSSEMDILVVAAHPDDEVLGCGGTVARLSNEGHTVYSAILGEGSTSRFRQALKESGPLSQAAEKLRKGSQDPGHQKSFPLTQLPDTSIRIRSLCSMSIRIVEDLLLK